MELLTKKLLALPNPEIVIQEVQKKLQKYIKFFFYIPRINLSVFRGVFAKKRR